MINRKKTRVVSIGNVLIGGMNPIAIQSMTNTKTEHAEETIAQILSLEKAGCDIIRAAVPNMEAAAAFREIKKYIHIPLVADIHFDYKLAIAAIENGADKVRINPGNIGSRDRVKAVTEAAQAYHIPIRVGVNSGSVEKELIQKYGHVTAEALVESALGQAKLLQEFDFTNIVISIKSSNILTSVKAHELISTQTDAPLHIGITEAGTYLAGNIKSAAGLGILLYNGIGDTIRVSLTDEPIHEVEAAKILLRSMGLRKEGITLVSCPTCGRTNIDLITLAKQAEALVSNYSLPLTVAVMGCAVNGPGEAAEADLGIAGGNGEGLLFKKGTIVRKMLEKELLNALKEELDKMSISNEGIS